MIAGGGRCGGLGRQLDWLKGRAYSIGDYAPSLGDRPGVLGWNHPDEPDGAKIFPEELPHLPLSESDGRVTFLTLTSHVFEGAEPLSWARPGMYPEYIRKSEMVGLDVYPLQALCNRKRLSMIFDSQISLARQAQGRPTFQWIETGTMEFCPEDPSVRVTAATVRNEFWSAIAGGAAGLGVFPAHFDASVRQELAQLTAEAAALAPALLNPTRQITTSHPDARASIRVHNGALYVLVVNHSFAAATSNITVPGLTNRELQTLTGKKISSQGEEVSQLELAPLEALILFSPPGGLG